MVDGAAGLGAAARKVGWASLGDCLSHSFGYYFWKNDCMKEAEACPKCLKTHRLTFLEVE